MATKLLQSYNTDTPVFGVNSLQGALNSAAPITTTLQQIIATDATCDSSDVVYYEVVNASGSNPQYGDSLIFKLPHQDVYYSDMTLELTISSFGGTDSGSAQGAITYFYADYPGVRLCNKVIYKRDGVELDSYTPIDVMLYRQFELDQSKYDSWDRSVGQQVAKKGHMYNPDAQIATEVSYFDGPQTRKLSQPSITLYIPLIFAFALDPKAAIFGGNTNFTDTTIQIDTAAVDKLFYVYNPTTDTYTPLQAKFAPIILLARLHVSTRTIPTNKIEELRNSHGFREYRRRVIMNYPIVSTSTNNVKLVGLNFLLEGLLFAVRESNNDNDPHTWHRFGIATYPRTYTTYIPGAISNLADLSLPRSLVQFPLERVVVTPIVDNIGLFLSDIEIMRIKKPAFYNAYVQTQIKSGGNTFDENCFAAYFGKKDGSSCKSTLDLTVKNTLYIKWDSSYIGQVELIVSAITLRVYRY